MEEVTEELEQVVRNWFSTRHVRLRGEWLRTALLFLESNTKELTNNDVCQLMWEQFENSDLRDSYEPPIRVPKLAKMMVLLRAHVFQVICVFDVSRSYYSQYCESLRVTDDLSWFNGDQEHDRGEEKSSTHSSANRFLNITVSDGSGEFSAIIYGGLSGVSEETIPGTKILTTGRVKCRQGVLMLNDKNCQVLEGNCEVLYRDRVKQLADKLNIKPKSRSEGIPMRKDPNTSSISPFLVRLPAKIPSILPPYTQKKPGKVAKVPRLTPTASVNCREMCEGPEECHTPREVATASSSKKVNTNQEHSPVNDVEATKHATGGGGPCQPVMQADCPHAGSVTDAARNNNNIVKVSNVRSRSAEVGPIPFKVPTVQNVSGNVRESIRERPCLQDRAENRHQQIPAPNYNPVKEPAVARSPSDIIPRMALEKLKNEPDPRSEEDLPIGNVVAVHPFKPYHGLNMSGSRLSAAGRKLSDAAAMTKPITQYMTVTKPTAYATQSVRDSFNDSIEILSSYRKPSAGLLDRLHEMESTREKQEMEHRKRLLSEREHQRRLSEDFHDARRNANLHTMSEYSRGEGTQENFRKNDMPPVHSSDQREFRNTPSGHVQHQHYAPNNQQQREQPEHRLHRTIQSVAASTSSVNATHMEHGRYQFTPEASSRKDARRDQESVVGSMSCGTQNANSKGTAVVNGQSNVDTRDMCTPPPVNQHCDTHDQDGQPMVSSRVGTVAPTRTVTPGDTVVEPCNGGNGTSTVTVAECVTPTGHLRPPVPSLDTTIVPYKKPRYDAGDRENNNNMFEAFYEDPKESSVVATDSQNTVKVPQSREYRIMQATVELYKRRVLLGKALVNRKFWMLPKKITVIPLACKTPYGLRADDSRWMLKVLVTDESAVDVSCSVSSRQLENMLGFTVQHCKKLQSSATEKGELIRCKTRAQQVVHCFSRLDLVLKVEVSNCPDEQPLIVEVGSLSEALLSS